MWLWSGKDTGEVVLLIRTVWGSVRVYFDESIELPENESLWRNRSWYSRPARVVKRTVIVGSMVAIRNCITDDRSSRPLPPQREGHRGMSATNMTRTRGRERSPFPCASGRAGRRILSPYAHAADGMTPGTRIARR